MGALDLFCLKQERRGQGGIQVIKVEASARGC